MFVCGIFTATTCSKWTLRTSPLPSSSAAIIASPLIPTAASQPLRSATATGRLPAAARPSSSMAAPRFKSPAPTIFPTTFTICRAATPSISGPAIANFAKNARSQPVTFPLNSPARKTSIKMAPGGTIAISVRSGFPRMSRAIGPLTGMVIGLGWIPGAGRGSTTRLLDS